MLTNQQAQFHATLQNQRPDLRRTMLEEIRRIRAEPRQPSTERTSSIPTFGSTPSTSSPSATPAPALSSRVRSGSAPKHKNFSGFIIQLIHTNKNINPFICNSLIPFQLSSSSSFFFQWQSWTIHGAHVVEPFAATGLVQFEGVGGVQSLGPLEELKNQSQLRRPRHNPRYAPAP
ncbi:hypothetical protein C1H46_027742 [Malus baccata]|uniref:Uncharacterized protein n=1 Tax=Malus baccata TaxID=106549 RepID=A0A540LK72_MALBA|nr:hypothetical protein C1H46_027742 [Malus baccata]